jgi:hypothetical protein
MSAQTDFLRDVINSVETQINQSPDGELRRLIAKGKRELDTLDQATAFSDPGSLPDRTRVETYLNALQTAVVARNAAATITGQNAATLLALYDAL